MEGLSVERLKFKHLNPLKQFKTFKPFKRFNPSDRSCDHENDYGL
ncbi:MAG TPA: hypothetical protein VGH22_20720 [Candidatus Binatia bacterium]